jgi:phosphoglycerate dehydrogenase-like enzyme
MDLADVTVGIIGLGDIGHLVAELLRGYGTTVRYFSRTRKPTLEDSLGIEFRDAGDLLNEADVVTLHLPANSDTQAFVAGIPFERATSPVFLVNTASQRLMPAERLETLFATGVVRAAAFDKIYDDEQLRASGLLHRVPEQLLVTNHSANATHGAWRRMTEMAVASILAHRNGQTPLYVVTSA